MQRLSQVDARLLEALEAKYGTDELVTVIQAMTPSIAAVVNDEETTSPEEATVDFIRKIEGHRLRMQEIHWNTKKFNTHRNTDDVKNMLGYIIDSVAENMQGLLGVRIKVGSVVPIMPSYTVAEDGYKAILNDILTYRASVDEVPGFEGVLGTLDNTINDLNKFAYLDTME